MLGLFKYYINLVRNTQAVLLYLAPVCFHVENKANVHFIPMLRFLAFVFSC